MSPNISCIFTSYYDGKKIISLHSSRLLSKFYRFDKFGKHFDNKRSEYRLTEKKNSDWMGKKKIIK